MRIVIFVDVRDVVKAYYLLLHKGKKGETYNICSGIGNSLLQVLNKMMNILKMEVDIKIDKELIRPADNQIIIGSSLKIAKETGWQPTISLEKSLEDILNYWEQQIV
jgi:GDP-4-dehydro-6-deoxy-D-mannose reductase